MRPTPTLFSFIPTLPCLRATSRSSTLPKRLQTGIYDGRTIQSGNAVGETYSNKTRRTWLPNVQGKSLYSEALGKKLRLKVTAGALRTIDKVGGLDAYLFRMKPDRLGEKGIALRKLVQEAHIQARIDARRAALVTGSVQASSAALTAE